LERGVVVVRLVYDGPPLAGKTTSIRALGRSLVRHVETPHEIDGRTVYFDWMEYTAGLFEGHQIRCQIVSVPGQPNLAPRRKALLLAADAVVFVADTGSPEAAARSAEYVTALARMLHEVSPPVGVVVQANKRDAPGAIGIPKLRALMGNAMSGVAITESVAHEAQGTRETFVLAVRLALDRVRDLVARGTMPRGRPEVDSADELLATFEQLGSMSDVPRDDSEFDQPPASLPPSVVPRERTPRLPNVRVPSGAIWPAVEGRLILHEAVSGDLRARRSDLEAWIAGTGTGWRIHSSAKAQFSEFDAGREAVVVWARAHAPRLGLLSSGRCLVVADSGDGAWRLWQIVRVAPSLRRWLLDMAYGSDAGTLLDALSLAARTLYEASIRPESAGLPMTFDSVGHGDHGAQIVSLMPDPGSGFEDAQVPDPEAGLRNVQSQLKALMQLDFWDRLQDLAATALHEGWSTGTPDEWRARVIEAIEEAIEGANAS
jgi:signal recognition particle receptor subunit beta